MPANTPNRNYPYQLYTEPTMDFPTAIESLAEAVDPDVTALESAIAGAYDRPSAAMSASSDVPVLANTVTTVSWIGATVVYDNDSMALPSGVGGIVLRDQGVYALSAYVQVSSLAGITNHGVELSFASTGAISSAPARTSTLGVVNMTTYVHVSTLHYHTGVGTDTITLRIWQNTLTARIYSNRQITATKVSNVIGGV